MIKIKRLFTKKGNSLVYKTNAKIISDLNDSEVNISNYVLNNINKIIRDDYMEYSGLFETLNILYPNRRYSDPYLQFWLITRNI